ncbi:MAG: hypothetical protein PVJ84_02800 [Desulfobacteraceae bacterium]|jgi:hypothetical protein
MADCTHDKLVDLYHLDERLHAVHLPEGSVLNGVSAIDSRLGVALGIRFTHPLQPTSPLVVLLCPIVIKTAPDLSISPHAMMMAIAMTVLSSFMTPHFPSGQPDGRVPFQRLSKSRTASDPCHFCRFDGVAAVALALSVNRLKKR